jgi:hypothetical protein
VRIFANYKFASVAHLERLNLNMASPLLASIIRVILTLENIKGLMDVIGFSHSEERWKLGGETIY